MSNSLVIVAIALAGSIGGGLTDVPAGLAGSFVAALLGTVGADATDSAGAAVEEVTGAAVPVASAAKSGSSMIPFPLEIAAILRNAQRSFKHPAEPNRPLDGCHRMRRVLVVLPLLIAACGRGDVVDEQADQLPPLDQMQMRVADWSSLAPAVGQRPAESGILTKGPVVTDLHALTGKDAVAYRTLLNKTGGPLVRDGKLLVTVSPPGPQAIYLIIDPGQRALEAGRKVDGQWVIQRTAAAEIARPAAVRSLIGG